MNAFPSLFFSVLSLWIKQLKVQENVIKSIIFSCMKIIE